MRNVRIGLDTRDLRIARTGAKTYLEEIIREFKKGHDGVDFFYFDSMFPVYTGKNKLLKVLEQLRFICYKQIILPIMGWSKQCDYLICTDFFVPWVRLGFQTIPVFHDAFFWEYPGHYNKYWLKTFRTLCVSAAKRSIFIVTPTEFAKSRILNFLPVNAHKIVVLYEGPKTFVRNEVADTPAIPVKGNYLLHVGVFEKRKNLVRLVEAFYLLKKNRPDVKLVLVGQFSPKLDMDGSAAVLKKIEELNLTGSVILPGYIADAELPYYYTNAFAYVFPSVNEGFGLPVLEAFHYGIPVVVANNSCLPEVGGDAVITFDPLNASDICAAVNRLFDDPGLRDNCIQKGTARLKHFSWRLTVAGLLREIRGQKNEI